MSNEKQSALVAAIAAQQAAAGEPLREPFPGQRPQVLGGERAPLAPTIAGFDIDAITKGMQDGVAKAEARAKNIRLAIETHKTGHKNAKAKLIADYTAELARLEMALDDTERVIDAQEAALSILAGPVEVLAEVPDAIKTRIRRGPERSSKGRKS